MKISKQYIAFIAANVLVLIGMVFVQITDRQLGYEIGSIYAGIISGTCIAIAVLPSNRPTRNPFEEIFRGRNWLSQDIFRDGTKEDFIIVAVIMGVGGLLAFMAMIGNNTDMFFRYDFEGKKDAAIINIFVAGVVYGMILFAHGLWFDYFIDKGRFWLYILAVIETILYVVIIIGVGGVYFQFTFFVLGLLSRSIISVLILKWHFAIDKGIRIYIFTAGCFLLLTPLIYRL